MGLFDQISTAAGQAFQNPLFNMGIGLLSNNTGHYGAFAPAFGQGITQGMQQYNRNREMLARNIQMKQQQEAIKRKLLREEENKRIWANLQNSVNPMAGPPQQAGNAMQVAQMQSFANAPNPMAAFMAAQPKPADPTSLMQNYEYARQNGYPGSFIDYQKATRSQGTTVNVNGPGGFKVPANYMLADPTNPQAGVKRIPGIHGTESEVSSAGYARRMQKAEQRMDNVRYKEGPGGVTENYDPSGFWTNLLGGISNYTASKEYQSYKQAQKDWVRAKLRKESGAVIAPEEMEDEITTYFPQPGDSDEVIEAKRKSREIATNNLIEQSQGAYERMFNKRQNGVNKNIPQPPPGFIIQE